MNLAKKRAAAMLKELADTAGGEPVAKTMHNSDVSGTRLNVPDVVKFGDVDMFQLICKASSIAEGWMKSTKACFTGQGCLVQVTTQQRNPDGSYAVAEALTYVPGICVVDQYDSDGTLKGRSFAEMSSAGSAPFAPSAPPDWRPVPV